jgi:hypothetical protein
MEVLAFLAILFLLAGLHACAIERASKKDTHVQVQDVVEEPTKCELMCERLREINCEDAANLSPYDCESWCPKALERGAWPEPKCVMDAKNCGHVMRCPYAKRGTR